MHIWPLTEFPTGGYAVTLYHDKNRAARFLVNQPETTLAIIVK